MIQLNYKEARPLYEQIKESIRKMVISNAFLADEKLPSVREMASQLAVNQMQLNVHIRNWSRMDMCTVVKMRERLLQKKTGSMKCVAGN